LDIRLKPINQLIKLMLLGSSIGLLGVTSISKADEILQEVEVKAKGYANKPSKGYVTKSSNTVLKTNTLLIDTPQSVTAIPKEVMQDQSVQSVADSVRYVPGVTAAQGEGNRDALVFRGNITTGDFFVDGIRDDVQTYRDFYNTERLEVLKGPNGMIFGRGGAGGVFNRVTKEAGWKPIRELSVSYGSYNQKRTSIDVGDAINDIAAFRINAVYEKSDSYRNGVDLERYGINPTVTIQPSDQTKIVLGVEYFKDSRIADRGVPSLQSGANSSATKNLGNRPYRINDYSQFFGNAKLSPTETETKAFNASIEHTFDNGMTIKNKTRYADYDKFYQNVFASSSVNTSNNMNLGAYYDATDRKNLINQTDLTFDFKTLGIQHQFLVGMEIGSQRTDNSRLLPPGGESLGSISALDPIYTSSITFNNLNRNQKSTVDIFGLYIQDQIHLNEQWQAIVGLRQDKFKTDYDGFSNGPSSFISENVTDNLLSPRAGLIFKPQNNISFYTNYSLSYVPRAGDQLTSIAANNVNADPEKFINYEIGAKWDITPQLSLTSAIYKLERQNVGITNPGGATLPLVLLDGQQTTGLELGLAGQINSKWSLFGGVTLQDGEVTKQQGSILKGAALGQTPDRMFSLWNRYQINETWAVAIGAVSRSEMYAQSPTASASTILPGYTRYDLAVFAKIDEKTRLQLNIENITNKDYALFAHNNNNITPGSPISARATLIYNF
jgi:catecholate siderophore receptor